VRRADAIWPHGRLKVVGCHSTFYANYLGHRRVVPIEANPAASGDPLPPGGLSIDGLVALHDPDAILLNRELTDSPAFKAASLAQLKSPAWSAPLAIGGGDSLYVRRR
jgi:hypothetical protein